MSLAVENLRDSFLFVKLFSDQNFTRILEEYFIILN